MNDITFVITHCMKKDPTNSSHIIKTILSILSKFTIILNSSLMVVNFLI